MKSISKISLLYSFILSAYLVLIVLIMNPFVVLTADYSSFDLLILFVLTFALSNLFFLLAKRTVNTKNRSIMFCLSFSLPLIIAGAVVWYLNSADLKHFLLFISTFFVASILPTLIVLIFLFFKNFKQSPEFGVSFNQNDPEVSYFELTNTKGKTTFKVKSADIIYFESNDNYVLTYYLDEEKKLKKSMDRLSLKSVESILESSEIKFNRVHKSFLINPAFVNKVSGRSQAFKINMQHIDAEIPVSRKFDVSQLNNY